MGIFIFYRYTIPLFIPTSGGPSIRDAGVLPPNLFTLGP